MNMKTPMKGWLVSALCAVVGTIALVGCKADDPVNPVISLEVDDSCVPMEQIPGWTVEPFKTNYTIQFPSDWKGTGMVGFEGNMFSKDREAPLGGVGYQFCGPLYCEDFGEELPMPAPLSFSEPDTEGLDVILENIVRFCDDTEVVAILYYGISKAGMMTYGRLYMKDNGVFQLGLTMKYEPALQEEIINVMKSIAKK